MSTRPSCAAQMAILAGLAGLALTTTAPADELPETVKLTGIVRDFKVMDSPNGHPDFENGVAVDGRYAGSIAPLIGDDGKPVFTGGGARVGAQWRDAAGHQICHHLYENFLQPGDIEGVWEEPGTGGITSASTFDQWFRDVLVFNMSAPLTLTLTLQGDGTYVFDDLLDPDYVDLGGFFPIDDQLFGNGDGSSGHGSQNHNYHFTFEVHAKFIYDASAGQNFEFKGTDTVWLFIDGHLVNDLIGVHASHDQYVAVDRLGLVDGQSYELNFFFAQRYRPQSHFRVQTNIVLDSLPIATRSGAFD